MDPEFKETVWGGTRIMTIYQKRIPSANTGESWEVAAHENGNSTIRNGIMAGKTLREAINEKPLEILGYSIGQVPKGSSYVNFPLIFKIIDADDDLSIQVHPTDEQAAILEGPGVSGKTEMWYVIDADEDAEIVYGFKKAITKEKFKQAAEEGTLENYINRIHVKKGDAFFIPAGTLHAICHGCLIAEVQQSCDTTYRVYDYQRPGLDGNPRPLQLDKAMECINFEPVKDDIHENIDEGIVCPYFQVYRRNLRGIQEIAVSSEHFQIMFILEGTGKVEGIPFRKGDTILLPAGGETVGLEGRAIYLQIL